MINSIFEAVIQVGYRDLFICKLNLWLIYGCSLMLIAYEYRVLL